MRPLCPHEAKTSAAQRPLMLLADRDIDQVPVLAAVRQQCLWPLRVAGDWFNVVFRAMANISLRLAVEERWTWYAQRKTASSRLVVSELHRLGARL